jgi:hypothetical protein
LRRACQTGCYSDAVFRYVLFAIALVALAIQPTRALCEERVVPFGARAAAMSGAFTAVADDASAFFWNPAGLAFGPVFQGSFQWGDTRMDRGGLVDSLDRADGGGSLWTDHASGFSVGMPFLGVSGTFGRSARTVREGELAVSQALETFDLAVSIVHSLPPDNLVVAANIHYLRGTTHELAESAAALAPEDRSPDALTDRVLSIDGITTATATVDLSALYAPTPWLRMGLMWRRLTEPEFETLAGGTIALPRFARAGVAFPLPRRALVALDFDLSRQGAGNDRWREVALGGEKRFFDDRLSFRAGVSAELGSELGARPAFSAGAGARIRFVRVDVAYVGAKDDRDRSVWLTITLSP